MASARINFITDPVTKKRARQVFSRLGLDLSTGLNIYLHHVAQYGEVPFDLRLPSSRGRSGKKG